MAGNNDPKKSEGLKAPKIDPELLKLIESSRYDDSLPPPPDLPVLTVQDLPIGTLGSMVCLTGLPKAGKGAFLKLILASQVFPAGIEGVHLNLPPDRRRILFFDTEHSNFEFYQVVQSVKQMMHEDRWLGTIEAYKCRQLEPGQIRRMIEHLVRTKPDVSVLFVDTLLDLCGDFNSVAESLEIGRWIKKITAELNILMVGVLHLGKKEQMSLGHLGSTIDRWARSVMRVEKDKTQKFFTLSDEYQRACAPFEPITLTYFNGQLTRGYLQPKEKAEAEKNPFDVSDTEHQYMIDTILGADGVDGDNLVKRLVEMKDITQAKARQYRKMWIARNWIYFNKLESVYRIHPKSKYNALRKVD